jgi:hypothetical protein
MHRRCVGALQKSIYQRAEFKQGLQWDFVGALWRRGRWACRKVRPLHGDMRFTAIRENDNKEQLAMLVQVPKELKRLAFERMVPSGYGDPAWIVPDVGSLRWFPSTKSITGGCCGSSNTGLPTSGSFA